MADPPPIPDIFAPRPAAGPGWFARQRIRLAPAVRQTWLNVKVWAPFLLNPADRARLATFMAREKRTGLEWDVRLPEQCWSCGRTDGLREREFEQPVRSFEYPLPIVGLGGMCVAFFLLIAWGLASWKFFLLALLCAGGIVVVLLIKSWPETVRVQMSTCADDARAMKFPECVVDQGELYLFLPNAKLGMATVVLAKAERLKRQGFTPFAEGSVPPTGSGYRPPSSSDDEADDDRPRYRPPPPPTPRHLPPLKLDGDDE